MTTNLPATCKYGMTSSDLHDVFSPEEVAEFYDWMRGQTGAICDGTEWDYAIEDYIETDCGPHGMVVYRNDVMRFIEGLPVVD